MLLAFSTWPEVEARLKRSTTIVVPIGSNEQHGPTGLIGTDWLCPEIIAHEAERRADILVAPTFNTGMAQHHLGFAGTIALRPSTFQAAIVDWVMSLVRHGLERIYFLNGHGGNIASIEAAFSETYAAASFRGEACPFFLRLRNWWEFPTVDALARQLFPVGLGAHATPAEIAVTQSAYPASIRNASFVPEIAPTSHVRDALDFRARFPDGRVGSNPSLATADKGATLIDNAVVALLAEIEEFANEPFLVDRSEAR